MVLRLPTATNPEVVYRLYKRNKMADFSCSGRYRFNVLPPRYCIVGGLFLSAIVVEMIVSAQAAEEPLLRGTLHLSERLKRDTGHLSPSVLTISDLDSKTSFSAKAEEAIGRVRRKRQLSSSVNSSLVQMVIHWRCCPYHEISPDAFKQC